MSRVAKKATKHFAKVAKLNEQVQAGGSVAVTARRRLKEMRDVYYNTDQYLPEAGAAWQPNGSNAARGSTGRAKKLLSGWNAKQKQGIGCGKR